MSKIVKNQVRYKMEILRVFVIFLHLIGFAAALFLVMREDLRLLSAKQLDLVEIESTARSVSRALMALFLTGALIVYVDTGFSAAEILARPKLLAKITVVLILTFNGFLLHWLVLPMLRQRPRRFLRARARLAAALGAVSSVSWVYATFLGIAKPLTDPLGYSGFITVYAVLLAGAVTVAMVFVAPRAELLLFGTRQAGRRAVILTT